MNEKKFSFIEAPIHQGQKHYGVSLGPSFIRHCLTEQDFQFSNFIVNGKQSYCDLKLEIYEDLSYMVEREIRRGQLVFTAGGDHSTAFGSIHGRLRVNPDLKVIWIDAHGDINTRDSSITGSFHGMPLSFLLGADRFDSIRWLHEYLKPENLIYFGLRDLDAPEKLFLDQNKIMYFTMDDILRIGAGRVINQITSEVAGSEVHLSLDVDAFDPEIAPATGLHVPNGLDFTTVSVLIRHICRNSNVSSFDFVELNPQIFTEPNDVFKTAQIGIDLFKIVLEYYQQKENHHGRYDRQCHSTESDLLHTNL